MFVWIVQMHGNTFSNVSIPRKSTNDLFECLGGKRTEYSLGRHILWLDITRLRGNSEYLLARGFSLQMPESVYKPARRLVLAETISGNDQLGKYESIEARRFGLTELTHVKKE